jgi:hypothetical protein
LGGFGKIARSIVQFLLKIALSIVQFLHFLHIRVCNFRKKWMFGFEY